MANAFPPASGAIPSEITSLDLNAAAVNSFSLPFSVSLWLFFVSLSVFACLLGLFRAGETAVL